MFGIGVDFEVGFEVGCGDRVEGRGGCWVGCGLGFLFSVGERGKIYFFVRNCVIVLDIMLVVIRIDILKWIWMFLKFYKVYMCVVF